jgi:hypothetical protein
MKKTLTFALVLLLSSCVFAQNSVVSMTGNGDTITDTGNDYVLVNVLGTYETVTLQAKLTKLTGDVSSVFATVQGSIDGTNFVDLNTDTLDCTNQTTNTKCWVIEGSSYYWYKIVFDGGGTQTSRVYGYMLGNPSSGKHASTTMLSDISLGSDTATNTGTAYVQTRVRGWYNTVSIQAVATKISGTAAGTITLQGSLDGTNFVTVPTNYLFDVTGQEPYKVDGTATLTVTNVTTSTKIFTVIGSPFQYYRLGYTGSGTMVVRLRGYMLPNKK